jgi:RNAse (barnase) inhibitor barstar
MIEKVHLDFSQITSEEEFHDYIRNKLSFPIYYGKNLDAFWDCITEITEEMEIEIKGLESLSPALRSDIESYIELIKACIDEDEYCKITLSIL